MNYVKEYKDRKENTGDYTGKCWRCGSRNLWDDETMYGCNDCGMMRSNIGSILVQEKNNANSR